MMDGIMDGEGWGGKRGPEAMDEPVEGPVKKAVKQAKPAKAAAGTGGSASEVHVCS